MDDLLQELEKKTCRIRFILASTPKSQTEYLSYENDRGKWRIENHFRCGNNCDFIIKHGLPSYDDKIRDIKIELAHIRKNLDDLEKWREKI